MAPQVIHFLGCDPNLLTLQMELASESFGTREFVVHKNIPVDIGDEFELAETWEVNFSEPGEENTLEHTSFSVVTPWIKTKVFEYFEARGLTRQTFINLLHPTSYVSPSVKLSSGIQVEPNCTLASLCELEFGVNIKRASTIGHHSKLGEYVTINPGVVMSSFVTVGNGTTIGSGAVIRDGVHIGENCMIGAGSVVVKDIPSNSVAFGNPCKVVRENS